jgi:oxygen-independent coproporphyrinogen-3 oxidase
MVGAMCSEIIKKKHLFDNENVETIYFGGGSPSFIQTEFLKKILEELRNNYQIKENPEITIECNPDDINREFMSKISSYGFNRVSLGIQSFFDEDLALLNRAHNANEAKESIEIIKSAGIENITIDLIYGLPNMTLEKWHSNIQNALDLGVPHISSYCLTIEDKTLLKHQIEKGELTIPKEKEQLDQFKYLVKTLVKEGFDHYEISNFSKPGFISKHNSSYWKNKNYLGFGPSAHSKVDNKRFWNISNNNQFIKRLETNNKFEEEEVLSEKDQFNELIMIGLRTKWGVSISAIQKFSFFNSDFQKMLQKMENQGKISLKNEHIYIEGSNKFIADTIISDLFIV